MPLHTEKTGGDFLFKKQSLGDQKPSPFSGHPDCFPTTGWPNFRPTKHIHRSEQKTEKVETCDSNSAQVRDGHGVLIGTGLAATLFAINP